jgi:acetyltransferase
MPFANKGSNGQTMLPTTYFRPLKTMDGEVLASNHNMLKLVATLGFTIATSSADPSVKKITKVL